jgi:hypothetical protein
LKTTVMRFSSFILSSNLLLSFSSSKAWKSLPCMAFRHRDGE